MLWIEIVKIAIGLVHLALLVLVLNRLKNLSFFGEEHSSTSSVQPKTIPYLKRQKVIKRPFTPVDESIQ